MATGAELGYNSNATALQMAQTIFSTGATVTGASFTGDARSKAIYSNGQTLSPGAVPANTGVILSTGRAADFTQSSGDPNRATNTTTNTAGPDGVAAFNALAGVQTFDTSYLDVDFIPTGNVLTVKLVFSSEEYPFVNGQSFNDVAGVWVNGSLVKIGAGDGKISVNNINQTTNSSLFVSNTNDAYNTEMDGFTVTLELTVKVNPGQVNSIRFGIADGGDTALDSNVMIGSGAEITNLDAVSDSIELTKFASGSVAPVANDVNTTGASMTVTHINGVAVQAGDSVTLANGLVVTLNANGTFTIQNDGDLGQSSFSYTVTTAEGITDTGFVNLNSVPCFVAGTLILTPRGEFPVERLRPGALVMTRDHGPQPVRWIGRRSVAAEGSLAPVRIAAGTFGDHRTLRLSPLHRILVGGPMAELHFGNEEVLVAARDLVDGHAVTIETGGTVEYVHVLFDAHQIIWSEGLLTESFLPGPQTTSSIEDEMVREICTLFPHLDPKTGKGYSQSARRALRRYEAAVLAGRLMGWPPSETGLRAPVEGRETPDTAVPRATSAKRGRRRVPSGERMSGMGG